MGLNFGTMQEKNAKKKKRKNKRKKKERERVAYLQITKLYRTFYRAVFFKYWPDSSDAPMVLDARISYYFSIVVPSDCLLIPRPYLSGKIAHPRLVQKHNETGRNRAEPFRLFISPPRSPTVISSGAVSSIQFILWIDSPRIYPPFRIKIKSLPSSVLSALLSRIRWIRSDFSKPSTREIMTDNNKKGLKRIVFVERLIVCCSEYTQSLNETL